MEARRWRAASGSRDAAVRHRPPSGLSTRSACAIGMLLLGLCGMSVHISISMGMRREASAAGGHRPGRGDRPRVERTEPNRKRNAPSPPRNRASGSARGRGRPAPGASGSARTAPLPSQSPVSGARPSRGAVRPRRTICAAASVDEEKTKSGHTGGAVRRHSAPLVLCGIDRARTTARGAARRTARARPPGGL